MFDSINYLDEFLSSDAAHPNSMGLSDLDGFLTGIACSPELIHVKEWLDRALGDVDEVPGKVMAAVTGLHRDIRDSLEAGEVLEPMFWKRDDGTVIAMDWCEGFMDAVKLRPERWDAFSQTKTGSELMTPILVHMVDDQGNSKFGITQEDLPSILDAAAKTIPANLPAIYSEIRIITMN